MIFLYWGKFPTIKFCLCKLKSLAPLSVLFNTEPEILSRQGEKKKQASGKGRNKTTSVHRWYWLFRLKILWNSPWKKPLELITEFRKPRGYKVNIQTTFAFLYISSGASLRAQLVKNLLCNAGDLGLIPGSERSPGEGNCNPLQYSCLENPKDRGAWQATVHVVARVGHDLVIKPLPY